MLHCAYVRITEVTMHRWRSNSQFRDRNANMVLDTVVENVYLVHPFLVRLTTLTCFLKYLFDFMVPDEITNGMCVMFLLALQVSAVLRIHHCIIPRFVPFICSYK